MQLFVKVCFRCAFVPDNVANSMSLLLALRISSFFSVSSSAKQQMISPLWKKQKPFKLWVWLTPKSRNTKDASLQNLFFFSILNSIYLLKKESRVHEGRCFVTTVIYSFTSEVIKDGEMNPNPSALNTAQKHIYLYLVHNQKCSHLARVSFDPMSTSFPYFLVFSSVSQTTLRGGYSDLLWVEGGQRPACMPSHLCLLLHSWTWRFQS